MIAQLGPPGPYSKAVNDVTLPKQSKMLATKPIKNYLELKVPDISQYIIDIISTVELTRKSAQYIN